MRISFLNLPKDHIGFPKKQGLKLKIGEILTAKVLKAGSKRMLLEIKGQKVLAKAKGNIAIGDKIKVRVAGEMQNKVILKLMNARSPQSGLLDSLLSKTDIKANTETREALAFLLKNNLPVSPETIKVLITDQKSPLGQLLQKTLAPLLTANTDTNTSTIQTVNGQLEEMGLLINPKKNTSELVTALKTLVQNLGLAPEEDSAHTIKKQALTLTHLLSSTLTEEKSEGVQQLLDKLTGMKLRQQEDGLLLHLEIPILLDQPTTALIKIRDEESNIPIVESEDRHLSILFQLNTDHLGNLKILVLLKGKEINCQFSSDREKTRMLLRKSLPELKDHLESGSYQVNQMGVSQLIIEEKKSEPLPGQVDFRV